MSHVIRFEYSIILKKMLKSLFILLSYVSCRESDLREVLVSAKESVREEPIFSRESSFLLEESDSQWYSEDNMITSSYAGAGVSFFYINNDEYLDLILARHDGLHIYFNDQSGGFLKSQFIQALLAKLSM